MEETTHPDKYTLKYEKLKMQEYGYGLRIGDRQLCFKNDQNENKIHVTVYRDNSWIINFDQNKSQNSIQMYKDLQFNPDEAIKKRLFHDGKPWFTEDKNKYKLGIDEFTLLNIMDHIHLIDSIGIQLDSEKVSSIYMEKSIQFDVFVNIIQKYSPSFSNEQIQYIREFIFKDEYQIHPLKKETNDESHPSIDYSVALKKMFNIDIKESDKYVIKYEDRNLKFKNSSPRKLDRQLCFINYHNHHKIWINVFQDKSWIIGFDQKKTQHSIEMYNDLKLDENPIKKMLFNDDGKQFFIEEKNIRKNGLDQFTNLNINYHEHLIEKICLRLDSIDIESSYNGPNLFLLFMMVSIKYSPSFKYEQVKYIEEFRKK